ncbi:MAG: hypothetical protein Q8S24_05805 [Eubacteriales bacterium]|nr:hypothetical protein [Eubacteriales bacterium]
MIKEIGSEFWKIQPILPSTNTYLPPERWSGGKQYFVSGRTALYAIIKEILNSFLGSKSLLAYLPSYCCHTMIEPFLQHDVSVDFYPVVFRDGLLRQLIDNRKQCDIILVMDYFGFDSDQLALPDNAIVIRDMTHALYSSTCNEKLNRADFLFASFRKWGPVAGAGVACIKNGEWGESAKRVHISYMSLRNKAYELKGSYVEGKSQDKKVFLEIFNKAEHLLERDYINYAADEDSIFEAASLGQFSSIRRRNAEILLHGLKHLNIVKPIFSILMNGDVPLFIPVLVNGDKRDALRKYLIENSVYCPIHWPLSSMHFTSLEEKQIYSSELSLICDQRYGEEDMSRQIELIRSFEFLNGK